MPLDKFRFSGSRVKSGQADSPLTTSMHSTIERMLDIVLLQASLSRGGEGAGQAQPASGEGAGQAQPASGEKCIICFGVLDEKKREITTACNAPETRHRFHSECLLRSLQYKANESRPMTCPICSRGVTGHKTIDVMTLGQLVIKVVVKDNSTVLTLKNQIMWAYGMPVRIMRIVNEFHQPRLQLEDVDLIPTVSYLNMVFRAKFPELKLFLDIPRCSGAPAKYKCQISDGLLFHPVRGADGYVYERSAIELWFTLRGTTSPMTGRVILPLVPVVDTDFASEIARFIPDPSYIQPPDNTNIEVNIVCPLVEEQLLYSFNLGDSLQHVVDTVHTGHWRIFTDDGYAFNVSDTLTLGRCRVKNGDVLYFQGKK